MAESAKAIIKSFLAQFGLGNLADWAWTTYTEAGGGEVGMTVMQTELPDTPEFQARFPAYKQLADEGRAMTPAQMLAYESTTRQIMHSAGIPAGFYDSPDDFAKLMVNDVSVAELEQRVTFAQTAQFSIPEETRRQLRDLYGVSAGSLTAFWLDPDRAVPLLERQFTAARTAAEADITGFGAIDRTQAERLVDLGVTQDAARQGFATLAERRQLFEAQTTGEDTIDTGTVLEAQFGGNANAARRIRQRQQKRQAAFAGASGFGAGQEGVTGLGSTT